MPTPLQLDLWPHNSPQSSTLLWLPQPPEYQEEEPTGGNGEGLTHSWDAGGEGVAEEYYSPPLTEEEENSSEEQSTESNDQAGWETMDELDLSEGTVNIDVEGKSYREEDEHMTIWQQQKQIEENPLQGEEEQESNDYETAGRSDYQQQNDPFINSSVEHKSGEGESERSFEHELEQIVDHLTSPIKHEEPPLQTNVSTNHTARLETTEASELPFLAGNPSSPTPPTKNLPLPRPASSAASHQTANDDNVSSGLTMEESQRRYNAPSTNPSYCMCPCSCSPTTQPPKQEDSTTKKNPTVTNLTTSRSRSTKRPTRYRSRYMRPPQTAKPFRKGTTPTPAKMSTKNYGRYTSNVGFKYPDFDTFGEFGSVVKSKPEESKPAPSQFYEDPSTSQMLLPYHQNTTSLPQKPTYVTPNVVFTTPAPVPQSSLIPPAKPILPSDFYEAPSNSQMLLPYHQNTTLLPQKHTYATPGPNVVFTTPPPPPIPRTSPSSVIPSAKPVLAPPQEPFIEEADIQSEENSFSVFIFVNASFPLFRDLFSVVFLRWIILFNLFLFFPKEFKQQVILIREIRFNLVMFEPNVVILMFHQYLYILNRQLVALVVW